MFYQNQRYRAPFLQLIPMIDVILVLLIFFMVVTTFPNEAGVEIEKPESRTAARLSQDNLLFAVTQDGRYFYSGREIRSAQAEGIIRAAVSANPGVQVIVQIDRRALTETLIEFLDVTRRAGARNTSVAAKPRHE